VSVTGLVEVADQRRCNWRRLKIRVTKNTAT